MPLRRRAMRVLALLALFAGAVGDVGSESAVARAYWEQADPPLAHISYNNGLHGSEARLVARWDTAWLRRWSAGGPPFGISLGGRRVGDYGIGAGLLGKLLCTRHHVSAYVGFDVAKRSLDAAKQKLSALTCATEFVHVAEGVPEFSEWRLDVLVCQQVIQHFPSQNYTLAWLASVERSRIPKVQPSKIHHHRSPPPTAATATRAGLP